jgi:hypothetical protein
MCFYPVVTMISKYEIHLVLIRRLDTAILVGLGQIEIPSNRDTFFQMDPELIEI